MNHVIFAIPGLMPPRAANWRRQLIAPEDGSLYMLIHCGYATDIVNYSLVLPGWHHGVIKDPGYNFLWPDWEALCSHHHHAHNHHHKHHIHWYDDPCFWKQFLTVSDQLPDDVMIPRRKVHGCPIPITELTDAEPPELRYFILKLPPRALPVGDTTLDVTVNGRVLHYIIQRPAFSIHSHRGTGYIQLLDKHRKNENTLIYNVLVTQNKESKIYLPDYNNFIHRNKNLRVKGILQGEEIELTIERGNNRLVINVPAIEQLGSGYWRAEVEEKEDEWRVFAGGEIVVSKALVEDEDPEDSDEESDGLEGEDSDDLD